MNVHRWLVNGDPENPLHSNAVHAQFMAKCLDKLPKTNYIFSVNANGDIIRPTSSTSSLKLDSRDVWGEDDFGRKVFVLRDYIIFQKYIGLTLLVYLRGAYIHLNKVTGAKERREAASYSAAFRTKQRRGQNPLHSDYPLKCAQILLERAGK